MQHKDFKSLDSFHARHFSNELFYASTPNGGIALFDCRKKQLTIWNTEPKPNRKEISLMEVLKDIPSAQMSNMTILPNGYLALCYKNNILIIDLEKINIRSNLKNVFPADSFPCHYSLTPLSEEKIIAVQSLRAHIFLIDIPTKSYREWEFPDSNIRGIEVACALEDKILIRCFYSEWSSWEWINAMDFPQLYNFLENNNDNSTTNEYYKVRRANKNYLVNIKLTLDDSPTLSLYAPFDLSKPIQSYNTHKKVLFMSSSGLCLTQYPEYPLAKEISVFSPLEAFFKKEEEAYLKSVTDAMEEVTPLPTVLPQHIIRGYLLFKNTPEKIVGSTPLPKHTP